MCSLQGRSDVDLFENGVKCFVIKFGERSHRIGEDVQKFLLDISRESWFRRREDATPTLPRPLPPSLTHAPTDRGVEARGLDKSLKITAILY